MFSARVQHYIGALKVNRTRKNTKPIKYYVLEIPTEIIYQHKDITHCMDIIFMNDMPMITGIDGNIRYQYLVCLEID